MGLQMGKLRLAKKGHARVTQPVSKLGPEPKSLFQRLHLLPPSIHSLPGHPAPG